MKRQNKALALAAALVISLANLAALAQQPLDRTKTPPPGPTPVLRVPTWTRTQLANGATLIVSDEGPGIAPADQQRIIERFERADAKQGGTGRGSDRARLSRRRIGRRLRVTSSVGNTAVPPGILRRRTQGPEVLDSPYHDRGCSDCACRWLPILSTRNQVR